MASFQKISILGSGGHAKVVLDTLLVSVPESIVTIYDSDPKKFNSLFMEDFQIRSEASLKKDELLHIAIGDNTIRMTLIQRHRPDLENLVTIQHKNAVVSSKTSVGHGCFIAAGSIISANSDIGHGVIINHGAVVDHDCFINNGAHIAPHVTLGGGVKVGTNALVGAGAVVLKGLTIGDNSIVGAGAVVTRDVPSGSIVKGIPAKEDT